MKIVVGASPEGLQPNAQTVTVSKNIFGSSVTAPDISHLSRIEVAVLDALTMAISQSISNVMQEPLATAAPPNTPVPVFAAPLDVSLPPVVQITEIVAVDGQDTGQPFSNLVFAVSAPQPGTISIDVPTSVEPITVDGAEVLLPHGSTFAKTPVREAILKTVDITLPPVSGNSVAPEMHFQSTAQQPLAANAGGTRPQTASTMGLGKTVAVVQQPDRQQASTIRIIPGPDTTGPDTRAAGVSPALAASRKPSQTRLNIRVPVASSDALSNSAGAPLDIEAIEREEAIHPASTGKAGTDQKDIKEGQIADRQGSGSQSSQQQSSQQQSSQDQTAKKITEAKKIEDRLVSEKLNAEKAAESKRLTAIKSEGEGLNKVDEDGGIDLSDFHGFAGAALPAVPAFYLQYPAFNRRLETNGVDETLLWVNAFNRDSNCYAGHLGISKPKFADTADVSANLSDTEGSTPLVFVAPEDETSLAAPIWLVPVPLQEPVAKRRRKAAAVVERRVKNVAESYTVSSFQPQMSDTRGLGVVECAAFRDRRIWRGSAPASARSGASSYPDTFTANAAFLRESSVFF